ncbi:MAG: hypothetical protein DMG02_26860 [Acidobacteria bacterium]|nr:MAG: hypothetical protein DMG02_26860 [Acidobacteriota bacterium]
MSVQEYLSENAKITTEPPSASGTTTVDTAAYDNLAFAAILFVVRVGSTAGNVDIRAQQSATQGGTFSDIAGSKIVATVNSLAIDLKRQTKQWCRVRITRGSATTVDGVVVVQYGAKNRPVVQPGSVSLKAIHGGADGVA